MGMATATTKLPVQLLQRVRQLAHVRSLETGREISPSALIREAVESYIQRLESR